MQRYFKINCRYSDILSLNNSLGVSKERTTCYIENKRAQVDAVYIYLSVYVCMCAYAFLKTRSWPELAFTPRGCTRAA